MPEDNGWQLKRLDKDKLLALPKDKQEAYNQRFQKLLEYKRTNPLFFYNHPTLLTKKPHQKQLTFHALNIRSKAFYGGNQSGKTTAGIADNLIQACDRKALPDHLIPFKKWDAPFKCRIFTPDLQDTMLVVQDKIKDLAPMHQLVGDSWDSAYDKQNRFLRFKNGSWFQFMSYEQDLQKLGSATLHRIHYDEEPPMKVYEECQPRLMRYGGDQIFTMTPLQGMSWTYKDIWGLSGGNDDDLTQSVFINHEDKVASVIVDMDDNPYLTEEAKEDTLRGFDANTRKARKEGRYVHFAGLIYNEFSELKHVKPPPSEKPFGGKNVNTIVSIDPGLITCAVLWGAVDDSNGLTVFDELYVQDWTIKEICERIKYVNAYHEIQPIYNVIDPHARDRSKQTGRSDQSEFTKNGVYTILGQNAVETGIEEIKQRLRDEQLIIYNNCRKLINEFKMYRWKESSTRFEEDQKPIPIKKDDHALDALRYMVMTRPYLPISEKKDDRSYLEKMMDEDKQKAENQQPMSEFGGGIYL